MSDDIYQKQLMRLAADATGAGQLDMALTEADEAVALAPADAGRYADRCNVLRLREEFEKAIVDCDRAVALDPSLPGAWLAGVDPSAEVSFELRESVSLAFMVALQKLNPRQRVVLLMRAVFNWKAEEVAELLGLTSASVNNLLYRARKNLALPQYKEAPAPKQNLDLFVNAWEAGDVPALIDLLHSTATFSMPPMGVWYAGPAAIGHTRYATCGAEDTGRQRPFTRATENR